MVPEPVMVKGLTVWPDPDQPEMAKSAEVGAESGGLPSVSVQTALLVMAFTGTNCAVNAVDDSVDNSSFVQAESCRTANVVQDAVGVASLAR